MRKTKVAALVVMQALIILLYGASYYLNAATVTADAQKGTDGTHTPQDYHIFKNFWGGDSFVEWSLDPTFYSEEDIKGEGVI